MSPTKNNQQVGKSEQFSYLPVGNIDEMAQGLPLASLIVLDPKRTKVEVVRIIHKYLSATHKAKSLNEFSYELITDDILETDKKLTLQEIDFIFRMGVIGKLNVIYGEISIDTILGEGGWIDIYYREYRPRKKIIGKIEYELTGKELTHEEYVIMYPEQLHKPIIFEPTPKCKDWTIELLKQKLGDSFDELHVIASNEYDNMLERLNILGEIIKSQHTVVEAGMYAAFVNQKKEGKEKFIINRLKTKVR